MNEALKKANAIKQAETVKAKEFRKWTESESKLQQAAEEYLQYFPNLAVVRVPDAAYRAIFANNHVSQKVKGQISRFLKGVPDLVVIKEKVKYITTNEKPGGLEFQESYNEALCIEFKVGKNKMSQGQKHFSERANVIECRSFEHFKELIDEFSN